MAGPLAIYHSPSDLFAATLIAHFEGFRSRPYQDQRGIWTIGFGTTRINGWAVVENTPPCTETQARDYLMSDMGAAAHAVDTLITAPLGDAMRAALISLVYNIGVGHFTSSTLRKQINAANDNADLHFLDWDMTNGVVNNGLLSRRKMERSVYLGLLTYTDFINMFPLAA